MSDSARRYTFPRTHRLKRKRLIASLFDRSRADVGTEAHGCVRMLYRWATPEEVGHDVPVQIGFAPGRRHATNVQRTRVRRHMREAYRQHQYMLRDGLPSTGLPLIAMMLFRGRSDRADTCIWRDVPAVLQKVAAALPEHD